VRLSLPHGWIDTTQRLAHGPGGETSLREKEARLLEVLADHEGQTTARGTLLREVFGYHETSRTRTLGTTVARCRQRLTSVGLSAEVLQTVYGEGYRLLLPAAPPQVSRASPPPTSDRLVGRVEEQLQLLTWLDDDQVSLITVTGMGGGGKTTLVRALTEPRLDACFVELARIDTLQGFRRAVALAAGAAADDDLEYSLERQEIGLLVLDNLEQLVPVVREEIARLIRGTGRTVVTTSRRVLGLPEEQVLQLGPLPADDARALFLARAAVPLGDDPVAHHRLARVLEGLDHHPLSIELAAARTAVMGIDDIHERLHERARLLRGDDAHPRRHRSVDALTRASVELLEPDAVQALAQAVVLPRDVTLTRFVQVVDVPGAYPEDLLGELVAHHLVRRLGPPDAPRFRVHEAVRAATTQASAPARRGAMERFVAAVVDEARRAEAEADGIPWPPEPELLAAARAAQELADHPAVAVLLGGLLHDAGQARDPEELRPLVEWLDPDELSAIGRARHALHVAQLATTADGGQALRQAEGAVAAARACRDDLIIARALAMRAFVRSHVGDRAGVQRDLDEAQRRHRWAGRLRGAIDAGLLAANTLIHARAIEQADHTLQRLAADDGRATGRQRIRLAQLRFVVETERRGYAASRPILDELLSVARREGTDEQQAWALLDQSYWVACQGRPAEAHELTLAALARASQAFLVARLLANLVDLSVRQLAWTEAREALRQAQRVAARGGRKVEVLVHRQEAWFARFCGDLERAEARWAAVPDSAYLTIEAHLGLLDAQGDRLQRGIERQSRQLAHRVAAEQGTTRAAFRGVLGELLLAAGRYDEAVEAIEAAMADPCSAPVDRPVLRAARDAARGRAAADPPTSDDPFSQVCARAWWALGLARAGDHPRAQAVRGELDQIVADSGLPPTSELAWRARACVPGAGATAAR